MGGLVLRPNQVWSTDITYIRLVHGFAYLAAIIDWYSRRVLSWRISNTMDTSFCVDCLQEALQTYGKPEVFNSDQGSQFTSEAFTNVLKGEGITISMDGRGRLVWSHWAIQAQLSLSLILCRPSAHRRTACGRC